MTRTRVPESIQAEVVTSCRRRCCICYGLNGDLELKRGQIAHLDKDRNNNKIDNLAFLCMDHHDEHDSRTSQSKSFLIQEIKGYREELNKFWKTPKTATSKDIVLATILEIRLAPHIWKNQFLVIFPNGWNSVKNYSTGEIWSSMIAMVDDSEFQPEDWTHYRSLFDVYLPHIVKEIESELILWGSYLSDSFKHKLQMSIRKLKQTTVTYRTLAAYNFEVQFIKIHIREALVNLQEVCEIADQETSTVNKPGSESNTF
jgi:hypothetical protein